MRQDRIIINDPRFGELSYHKKFSSNETFPGEKYLCWHPFNYIEVRRHGGINICCPQWNPAEIGNIFDNSLEEIWNGEKAKIIRDSILNGDYSYCDHNNCPKISQWQTDPSLVNKTESSINELTSALTHSTTPNRVHFVVDHSCNLVCPSCRNTKLTQLDEVERNKGLDAVRRTLQAMFKEPHNEHKIVSMDGSGEVFSSELYRELFETEQIFTDTYLWPNLNFSLSTNGTMMTEKIQQKYKNFFDHISYIEISIDAGNEDSYNKVRVGGHWDLLWKNIEYFYANAKHKVENFGWAWNIIVQKNNYESIPELIELASRYTEKRPKINFATVLNWGTWTEGEYIQQAVHLPSHPDHQKYMAIMNSQLVKDYRELVK